MTTAGFRLPGDVELWEVGDAGYTELSSDLRDLQVSHFSPNFDRVGVAMDLNTAYPVDRLEEMAVEGAIGSVNHRHFSFMGAQGDLSTIIQDTGPAVAQLLVDDEIDVVLLTPI